MVPDPPFSPTGFGENDQLVFESSTAGSSPVGRAITIAVFRGTAPATTPSSLILNASRPFIPGQTIAGACPSGVSKTEKGEVYGYCVKFPTMNPLLLMPYQIHP